MVSENEYGGVCVVILNVHLPLNQPTPEHYFDHRHEPNTDQRIMLLNKASGAPGFFKNVLRENLTPLFTIILQSHQKC